MKVRHILIGLYLLLVYFAVNHYFTDSRDSFHLLPSLVVTLPWSMLIVPMLPKSCVETYFIIFDIVPSSIINSAILWCLCALTQRAKKMQ
jgi:hypothetical protein